MKRSKKLKELEEEIFGRGVHTKLEDGSSLIIGNLCDVSTLFEYLDEVKKHYQAEELEGR